MCPEYSILFVCFLYDNFAKSLLVLIHFGHINSSVLELLLFILRMMVLSLIELRMIRRSCDSENKAFQLMNTLENSDH